MHRQALQQISSKAMELVSLKSVREKFKKVAVMKNLSDQIDTTPMDMELEDSATQNQSMDIDTELRDILEDF